jgi:hypothetical protein
MSDQQKELPLRPTAVAPGRTAQCYLEPESSPMMLLGIGATSGALVERVLCGDQDLTPGDGGWSEAIGEGVVLGPAFLTVIVRNPTEAPVETQVVLIVAGAAPEARSSAGGQAGVPAAGRRFSVRNGQIVDPQSSARIKRVISTKKDKRSRTERSAAEGPERRARIVPGPDEPVGVVLTHIQRHRLADMIEGRSVLLPAEMPAILHALTQARGPDPEKGHRQGAVVIMKKHVDEAAHLLQSRRKVSPEARVVLAAALRTGQGLPRNLDPDALRSLRREHQTGEGSSSGEEQQRTVGRSDEQPPVLHGEVVR